MRGRRGVWLGGLVGGLFMAGYAHATDVAKLDIFGVRLYMSAHEALDALKQHLEKGVNCQTTEQKSRLSPGKNIVGQISCRAPGYTLLVNFSERGVPTDNAYEGAYSIDLLLNDATEADSAEFFKKVRRKYPTFDWWRGDAENASRVTWCAVKDSFRVCLEDQPLMEFTGIAESRPELSLHDYGYSKQLDDALKNAEQRVRHGTPQP